VAPAGAPERRDAEELPPVLYHVTVALELCRFLRKSNITRGSFRSILKRAGVPADRFHDLRHCAASRLLAAGINALVIKERLGHERVDTTLSVYSHRMKSAQAEAASKMDAVFTPKPAGPAAG
jgi:integrase